MTFDFKDFRNYKPKMSKRYMTLTCNGNYMVLPYSVKHGKFNTFDYEEDSDTAINVMAWAEITYPKSIQFQKLKRRLKNINISNLPDLLYDIGELTDTNTTIINDIVDKLNTICCRFKEDEDV